MTTFTLTSTVAAALLVAACTTAEKKAAQPATEVATPQTSAPTGSEAGDHILHVPPELEEAGYDRTYGATETFSAALHIDATVGGKAFQGVWLEVEDGRTFLIAYRPDAWRHLEGKRVRATGRPYTPGALTQHIMAAHFEVETIDAIPIDVPSWTSKTETVAGQLIEEPMGVPGSKLAEELILWLVLDDGTRLLVSGADNELVGKRVMATGRRWKPSPYVAHIGDIHFDADKVVAAEAP